MEYQLFVKITLPVPHPLHHHPLHHHHPPHQVTQISDSCPPATCPPPLQVTPTSIISPPAISHRVVLRHRQAAAVAGFIIKQLKYSCSLT